MTTYEVSHESIQDFAEAPPSSRGGFSIFFLLVPLVVVFFAVFLFNYSFDLQAVFFTDVEASAVVAKSLPLTQNDHRTELSPIFTPSVLHWEPQILDWASGHDLEPNLVAALIQIESCGDPKAESSAGAASLFQVMPFHFKEGENPFDIDLNAYRGLTYFTQSLNAAQGDTGLAFAGYNGGIGIIDLERTEWAQQTRDYQYWAENIMNDVQTESDETINEWLNAGGYSLCRQAENRLSISLAP